MTTFQIALILETWIRSPYFGTTFLVKGPTALCICSGHMSVVSPQGKQTMWPDSANQLAALFTHLKWSYEYSSSVCGLSVGSADDDQMVPMLPGSMAMWDVVNMRSDCSIDCCANRFCKQTTFCQIHDRARIKKKDLTNFGRFPNIFSIYKYICIRFFYFNF